MPRKALIVIDIQNDYFPQGDWPLAGVERAAGNAARLIAAARDAGEVVVHIRHEFESGDAPFFRPASEGAAIHASVAPVPGEHVVLKHRINSYLGTDLKAHLDTNGVSELVICGNMSHMCVDAATRASADFGYRVTLVHDACASRDLQFDGVHVPAEMAHAAFMSALSFAYAKTVSTEEYLALMAEVV
ncbi:cysteine hydrolase family protein [Paracoccus ravus]|uniref:cysteine hydrolase family protein n=1 Tax=Paracoccus ravus TaxID=2447760 RepID=UPI00106EB50D|nr:cysteine hydrolase family protein [Paracoccus ravus]